jgi:S-formylglutathione hydrolase
MGRIFQSRRPGLRSDWGAAPVLAALSLLLSTWAFPQAPPAAKHGTVERIKVHGVSLEGNLEGDSPDRDVSVYLPPGYEAQKSRRYPVIYLLHGITDSDLSWFGSGHHFDGTAAADRAFSNDVPEMIVVMPDAKTRYFGSMYSSSATIGDWESFVAQDLVAYIDGHYRTLANRRSRGLAGHSMGGYGTIRLGMKHPEVFSSIYALSACCLAPMPNLQVHPARTKLQEIQTDEQLAAAEFMTKALFASAAAWSPDPKNPPRYLDFPWKGDQYQRLIGAKWAANAPLVMLDQYVANLKRLHAIAFDVGTQDTLLPGAQALDQALTDYGIAHTYETYDGDHLNRIEMRFEKNVLPFFGRSLTFGSR